MGSLDRIWGDNGDNHKKKLGDGPALRLVVQTYRNLPSPINSTQIIQPKRQANYGPFYNSQKTESF
jgi:hypothetical protein